MPSVKNLFVLALILAASDAQALPDNDKEMAKRGVPLAPVCASPASRSIELSPASAPGQTWDAMQKAMEKAAATGCPIHVKAGIHPINRDVSVEANRIAIVCDPGAVFRKVGQTNGLWFKGAFDSMTGRCEIDGANYGGSGMIVDYSASDARIEHVFSHHNGGHGILNRGARTLAAENRTEDNGRVGFANDRTVGSKIISLSSRRNGNEGLTIDNPGTAHVTVQGGLIEENCRSGGVGNIGIDAATDVTVTDIVAKNPLLPCKWNLTAQNNAGNTVHLNVTGGVFSGAKGGDIHFVTNTAKGFTTRDSSVRRIKSESPIAVLADPGTSNNIFQVEGKVVGGNGPSDAPPGPAASGHDERRHRP